MSTKLRYASGIAVAVTFLTTLLSAEGSGAAAQIVEPASVGGPVATATSRVEQAPAEPAGAEAPSGQEAAKSAAETVEPARHAELTGKPAPSEQLSREMHCLAGAIYFEAKGESLEGQLAVGRVVVNRSQSGRFPASYCGVVYQRSQFSFVRGKRMPAIDQSSKHWANAVKMAKAAHEGSRRTRAEGALFFHAARVSPGWRLTRLARIDNHVFYR